MEKEYEFYGGKTILMDERFFKLTTDTVLLSDFASVRGRGLDLGAGIGCLGLLVEMRHGATVDGVEISEGAAALAAKNYERLNASGKIFASDFRELKIDDKYDFCVSNPPYFGENTGKCNKSEEISAARHADCEPLFAAAKRLMKYSGRLYFCIRADRLISVFSAMQRQGFSAKRMRFVHDTAESKASLALIEACRGGDFVKIEKPLILKDENGFTKEYCRIYGR